MGQELSIAHNQQLNRTLSSRNLKQGIDHEGILKYRTVPFRDSTQVSTAPALFLENADYTLKGIFEERQRTNKLLTEQDLLKLLESVLYTLAYLQSKGLVYRDLVPQNIYYVVEEGTFKLLPPELIEKSSYELMLDGTRFSLISPEMLIALRQQRQWFNDHQFHKSNVFMLGMIMLEAATLKPSCLCYEDNTLDILDKVVKERLNFIRKIYPEEFARLLERMLEYDANERMSPQELALYLNQYFSKSGNVKPKLVVEPAKPYLSTHPAKFVQQSQMAAPKASNAVRQNPLATSSIMYQSGVVNYDQEQPQLQQQNPRQPNYLTPSKVRTVYREMTPPKIVRAPPTIILPQETPVKSQGPQVVPYEVLKFASNAHANVENPEKPAPHLQVTPPKKEFTNEGYTETRQSVLNKYSRAKDILTSEAAEIAVKQAHLKRERESQYYHSPIKSQTTHANQTYSRMSVTPDHDRIVRARTSFSPPPALRQMPIKQPPYLKESALRYDYNRFANNMPSDPLDSPIRTRYPVTDQFSPSIENASHQTKLDQLRAQENSTDQSINRIRHEIQKSRRLIQQFQKRNRATQL